MLLNPSAEMARVYLVSLWLCLTIVAQGMSEPSELTNKNHTELKSASHVRMACVSDDSNVPNDGRVNFLLQPTNQNTISISDPCSCRNNASTLTNGQFNESIEVEAPSGETWTLSVNEGLYETLVPNSSQSTVLLATGAILVEVPIGVSGRSNYVLTGVHVDAIGYSISVTNGTDILIQSNECYYPNPMILDLSDYVCTQTPAFMLNASVDQTGTGVFSIDGVDGDNFDPLALGDGFVDVVYEFDADGVPGPGITEPGCIQSVTQVVQIDDDPGVACIKNINVSLQNACEIEITVDMVQASDQCMTPGLYSIVLKDTNDVIVPGNIIRKIGKYYAEVTNTSTGVFCWGYVHAEDKILPVIICPNDTIIDCQVSREPFSTGLPVVTDNCNPVHQSYVDSFDLNICGVGDIFRTWTATDNFSNTSTCRQVITIIELDPPVINWPEDITLDCMVDVSNLDPDSLDFPYSRPVFTSDCRQLAEAYKDQIYDICAPGSFKLFRYWTIRDWCDPSVVYRDTQLIMVIDTVAPTITCPDDVTLSTMHDRCDVDIPTDRPQGNDLCDANLDYRREVRDIFGVLINSIVLAPGVYEIKHYLTDDCQNESSCIQTVTVEDGVFPNAICDRNTNISLTSAGFADVCFATIDDRSSDNCAIEDVLIKLDGESDNLYRECITFDCSHIGKNKVFLRVTDIYGNENSCWANVYVEDKTPPRLICPPDVSLSCLEDYSDPNNTGGYPTVLGNCSVLVPEYTDSYDQDNCPVKVITRTWRVEKLSPGNDGILGTADDIVMSDQCNQIINVVDTTGVNIEWPSDLVIPCTDNAINLSPVDLIRYNRGPIFYDAPRITGQDCERLGISHTDMQFDLCGPESYKIRRIWHIVDWCSDLDTSYIQTVWVRDEVKPDLVVDDIIVDITTNIPACEAYVVLNASATDNCTQVRITNDSRFGIGRNADASGLYPKGISTVTFTATDACGNTTKKTINITVRDAKAPVAFCGSGYGINLKATGEATICADVFDMGSYDNCTFIDNLRFYIQRMDDQGSLIGNAQECLTYTCTDFLNNPLQSVQFIVVDAEGNRAVCNSLLQLQDHGSACSGTSGSPTLAFVQGQVNSEDGSMVDNLSIYIDNQMVMNGVDGSFLIDSLRTGRQYSLNIDRSSLVSDGVNTLDLIMIRRHILRVDLMESPYQLIAADVNGDEKISSRDMIEIRQVILRMISGFSSGENWRFIPSDYIFSDNASPWDDSYPDVRTFQLNDDISHLDFISIKLGDVNQSVMLTNNLSRDADNRVDLLVDDIELSGGEESNVSFDLEQAESYLGAQFVLSFDKYYVDGVSLKESVVEHNSMAIFETDKYINLVCTWINEGDINEGYQLLELNVITKEDVKLSEVVKLSSNSISNEIYESIYESKGLRLSFINELSYENKDSAYKLYQNAPNPYSGRTNISFEIPIPNWVELQVFDLSGKLVWYRRGYFSSGMHSVQVHESDLKEKGLLIYKITSGSFSDSKRMIVLE